MHTVWIDFETYYSSKEKYSLKSMSLVEYIHHPEFEVQGFAIKIDEAPTQWVPGQQAKDVLSQIQWSDTRVIAHNVKFDGAILAWKYGARPSQWIDTRAMVKAVLGNSIPSASLKDAAEALGLPAKGELKTNNIKILSKEQEQQLAEYCIRDTDLCHDIFHATLKYFPDSQWDIMDWTVRAFLEPQLVIDGKKCEDVYHSSIENKNRLIANAGVEASVLRSNQQFAHLLRVEGFPVPEKKNKTGKLIPALSLQDKEFSEMSQSKNPRLQQLYLARVAAKQTLEETRAKKMWDISKISKYCFDVIFSGAQQTHRFSGGSGCAGNPQNFKRGSELRAAIAVPKGKTLVVADFSNIELRVLAFLSRDPELMSAIYNKEDVYCKFASKIYGREITKQNDKKERALGKAAVLGLGYGMGAEKFRNAVYAQTGEMLSVEFAKNVVKLYREAYTGVPKFWHTCEKVLEHIASGSGSFPGIPFLRLKQNMILLPSQLPIKFNNLRFKWKQMFGRYKKEWTYDRYKSKAGEMDATKIYGGMLTENLCQGIAGDICKETIKRLIEYGYPPSGQVHDELLVVCDEDEVEKVKFLVASAMTNHLPWWKELPLEVEIGTGKNWLEAK